MDEYLLAPVQPAEAETSHTFLVIPDPDDQSSPPQVNYYITDETEIQNWQQHLYLIILFMKNIIIDN